MRQDAPAWVVMNFVMRADIEDLTKDKFYVNCFSLQGFEGCDPQICITP